MKREFSLYLDLVRFCAALLVVLYHSNMRLISTELVPFAQHGHLAVIAFFVLSGYVIAYISDSRENTPRAYWASRLARIYPLAIPAVLLTPVLDSVGEALHPALYDSRTTHDFALVRIVSSLLFLNETWKVSIMSFSNVPYWSLCYEMFYYVLYALVIFLRGRQRTWAVAAACLVIGPKVLLLAPVWLLGTLLYHWRRLHALPEWLGALLFAGSAAGIVAFESAHLTDVLSKLLLAAAGPYWHNELAFSRYFLGDYALGLLVCAHFAGARSIAGRLGPLLLPLAPLIRHLSAYTFALYLFHQPLLQFFAALIQGDPSGRLYYLQVLGATLLTIYVAGSWLESRRGAVREWLFERLGWMEASRLVGART